MWTVPRYVIVEEKRRGEGPTPSLLLCVRCVCGVLCVCAMCVRCALCDVLCAVCSVRCAAY